MSTIKEIVYKIKEAKSSYNVTDDFIISDELIISKVNDVREVLIMEEFNRTSKVDDQYYQYSCCHEIKCYSHTCMFNGRTITISVPIYKVDFPELIHKVGNLSIKHIGNVNGAKFNYFSFDAFWTIKSRLWTKNAFGYTVAGNEILLNRIMTPEQKYVCAMLLLKNPTSSCDYDLETTTYPVPNEMKLIDMVLYRLNYGAKDVLNNSTDDLIPSKINESLLAQEAQASNQENQEQRQQRQQAE
jgi:hypothetical protein